MGLSRADSMVGVLVDACGWVSLVDAGLNLDISLNKAIGEAELKITDSCLLYTSDAADDP